MGRRSHPLGDFAPPKGWCNDGIDNDGNGKIDFTGGPLGEPADPNCSYNWDNYEHPSGCGIGFELIPIACLLPWAHRRWRARPPTFGSRRDACI